MVKFKIPKTLKHKETEALMRGIVKILSDTGEIGISDIPQLHRMATAYDIYLTCFEFVSENGLTMKNLKGETVKRPEANLLRESWSQYLEVAKEYGLTKKKQGTNKRWRGGQERR